MIRRKMPKLSKKNIPITQVAYRKGRSTTEHVYTFKTLAEKVITSSNYEIHILMLNLCIAFDPVKRATLIKDLKEILDDDEIHMMYILLKVVEYQVRCGNTLGNTIKTNIGTPPGDCLSAVLFTFYLAKSLEQKPSDETHEHHTYAEPDIASEDILPTQIKDHNYCKKKL